MIMVRGAPTKAGAIVGKEKAVLIHPEDVLGIIERGPFHSEHASTGCKGSLYMFYASKADSFLLL